jgi:hypothetical protein
MSDTLIARLAGDLQPVHRLAPPWRRAALWLCAAIWLAGILALFTDFTAVAHRLMAAPDMALAAIGAVLTGVLAAVAAFLTSVPGRSAWWAALPAPALVLWLAASGAGCLRRDAIGWTEPEGAMHPMACLYFIVLVSAPLAGLLVWQIMRACPLRPALTASLAGLASAGTAAALLTLIHPFDATASDLAAHFVAVLLVVVGAQVLGGRPLGKVGGNVAGVDAAPPKRPIAN